MTFLTLRTIDQTLCRCYACQTDSASSLDTATISDVAPISAERISGTRCDACGDIRLYQSPNEGTPDPEIRVELDELAQILSVANQEVLSNARH